MNRYLFLIILVLTFCRHSINAWAENKRTVDMVVYPTASNILREDTQLNIRYIKTGKVISKSLGRALNFEMDADGKSVVYQPNAYFILKVFDIDDQSEFDIITGSMQDIYAWSETGSVLGVFTQGDKFKAIDMALHKVIYKADDIPSDLWAWWGSDAIIYAKDNQLIVRNFDNKILTHIKLPDGYIGVIKPSPDHRFVAGTIGATRLFVIDTSGKIINQLSTNHEGYIDSIYWTNDNKIAYQKGYAIHKEKYCYIGILDIITNNNKKVFTWIEKDDLIWRLAGWDGDDLILSRTNYYGKLQSETCFRFNVKTKQMEKLFDAPGYVEGIELHYSVK